MVLNMVQVREVGDAEDPVNWRLWTDEETGDFDSSAFVVVSYTHRWKIEELNKCAKTGVGVEDRQFTDVKRFSSFLAMAFVVAWRMLATRTVSEVEGGTAVADAFMEDEVEYLGLQAKAYKMEEIRTVAQAILLIAKMGGYLGTYKKPGWQVLWGGWMRFYERVIGFQVTKRYLKTLKKMWVNVRSYEGIAWRFPNSCRKQCHPKSHLLLRHFQRCLPNLPLLLGKKNNRRTSRMIFILSIVLFHTMDKVTFLIITIAVRTAAVLIKTIIVRRIISAFSTFFSKVGSMMLFYIFIPNFPVIILSAKIGIVIIGKSRI